MKLNRLFLLLTSPFVLLAPALHAESPHEHHGHDSSPKTKSVSTLKLDAKGNKWKTDLALRKGMEQINALMRENLQKIHTHQFKSSDYSKLSEAITSELGLIFRNCKLSPDADAVLHVLLSQIISGANEMKSNKELAQLRSGAISIIHALESYPKYFNHAEWKPLQH